MLKKSLLFILSLGWANLSLATLTQISFYSELSKDRIHPSARHFRYDSVQKKLWLIGNSSWSAFQWTERTLNPAQAASLELKLSKLKYQRPEAKSDSAPDIFRVVVDGKQTEWKGYSVADAGTRSGDVYKFLTSFFDTFDEGPASVTFDGKLSFNLDIDSLSKAWTIALKVTNSGTQEVRLNMISDSIKSYMGYLPMKEGDAIKAQIVPPKSSVTLWLKLDRTTFKKGSYGRPIFYVAQNLVDTGMPQDMQPLFQHIQGAGLPPSSKILKSKS